jgi:hypothetical protein
MSIRLKWSELKWKKMFDWHRADVCSNGQAIASVFVSTSDNNIWGGGRFQLIVIRPYKVYNPAPDIKPPSQFNAADVMAILAHEYDIEWV